ncbi:Foldase protein PrsA precursor [hydrothermal vent metagenome]|uniref:Foldase protein PrsA n=1 Tax=hydrothermal vent metagenome TaxID=652676 RepID=A0A1W1CW79_9ZZZZ
MKIILKLFMMFYTLFLSQSLIASEVVATVNGSDITQKDVNDFVVSSIPGASFSALTYEQQKGVINQMINRKLFLEDAKKMNIASRPEFIKELEKEKENLMLDFWMKDKVEEIAISDRDAKIYYRDNIQKFNRPASVKVRHILLASEAEARDIIQRLKRSNNLKKDFISLAKEKSTGPSAVNGGELDWFIKEQMVPEFSEAAFSLQKGKITTQPVKTQFGYHVIYLEDKKEQRLIPFEMVKSDIINVLRRLKFKAKLERLSKKMKKTAIITVK